MADALFPYLYSINNLSLISDPDVFSFLDYSHKAVYMTACVIWSSSLSTELLWSSSKLHISDGPTSGLNALDSHIVICS